jgi:hypothetical protein
MVLAKPNLIIVAPVKPLNQLKILFERQCWVDAGFVEWCQKNSKTHTIIHGNPPYSASARCVRDVVKAYDKSPESPKQFLQGCPAG